MASALRVDTEQSSNASERFFKRALDRIREGSGVSLAFGGVVDTAGVVHLNSFSGPTTGALPGTRLGSGEGLGGRAVKVQRGLTVNDYFEARGITHHYDAVIRSENLRSLVAVPIIVQRRVVAMVYAAQRNSDSISGRIEQFVSHEARALEQEILLRSVRPAPAEDGALQLARLQEYLQGTYQELLAIAMNASEPAVREGVSRLADKILRTGPNSSAEVAASVALTRREKEVLALAGAGLSNPSIAGVLGLTLYTVKSYMKSAMFKLASETRTQAVLAARSQGLIP